MPTPKAVLETAVAIRAMTTADTVDFVSAVDPSAHWIWVPLDPDNPSQGRRRKVNSWDKDASVFKIGALDVFLMGHIYDSASVLTGKQGSTEVGIQTRVNQTNIDAVRFGLKALPDNFRDKNDRVVDFKVKQEKVNGRDYTVVDDSVVNALGLTLIAEMAEEIKQLSQVSGTEEKNSGGESLPSS